MTLKVSQVPCPQGMSNVNKDDWIMLNMCIYGPVKAVRHYHKSYNSKEIGIQWLQCQPISLFKKSEKGIVCVALYIDDNLMVGELEVFDKEIAAFEENGMVLKIMEGLQDYLFCKVRFS